MITKHLTHRIYEADRRIRKEINSLDENRWETLENKLDVLIRLLSMTVGAGLPLTERAPILRRAGLDRNAIAAVCDASAEAVSVRLAEAKRKKSPKKKRRG